MLIISHKGNLSPHWVSIIGHKKSWNDYLVVYHVSINGIHMRDIIFTLNFPAKKNIKHYLLRWHRSQVGNVEFCGNPLHVVGLVTIFSWNLTIKLNGVEAQKRVTTSLCLCSPTQVIIFGFFFLNSLLHKMGDLIGRFMSVLARDI